MDVIILLQGGSGVQSVQLILATLLHAYNALIFFVCLASKRRRIRFSWGASFACIQAFLIIMRLRQIMLRL